MCITDDHYMPNLMYIYLSVYNLSAKLLKKYAYPYVQF